VTHDPIIELENSGTAPLTSFQPIGADVYDNHGATVDRYTLIIDNSVFCISSAPSSSQGVNQYVGELEELRDPIARSTVAEWGGLNNEIRLAVWRRFFSARLSSNLFVDEIENCLVVSPFGGGVRLHIKNMH